MGKKSVVFVAELSYMEKLEVALKSLCAHKGQWKIYVLMRIYQQNGLH